MNTLSTLLLQGTLLNFIIMLIAAEALLLLCWGTLRGKKQRILPLLPNLLSGALLMLCVRLALTDAPAEQMLLLLALIFVTHLVDLAIRLRPIIARP